MVEAPATGDKNEQDRYLPIANIGRIMKEALPQNAKIAKDARETMQECVSEFISFITSEACERCTTDKRKTINGDDLTHSMHILGFENYTDNIKNYYAKYK
jgi:nuclear transcription Y subunit beta